MSLNPIVFSRQAPEGETFYPKAERILSGDPKQRVWIHYTDPSGQFVSGLWQCEPGCWKVVYDAHEEEFCQLIEGEVVIRNEIGQETRLSAGDSFVIPGGFCGTWECLTPTRKYFATMVLVTEGA